MLSVPVVRSIDVGQKEQPRRERRNRFLRAVSRTQHIGDALAVFGVVAVVAAALFAFFEGRSFLDGLWWTVVTLTTVGYGDLTPVTAMGRVTAVVLMGTGIAMIAFVTAEIAAGLAAENADRSNPTTDCDHTEQALEAFKRYLEEHPCGCGTSARGDTDPA